MNEEIKIKSRAKTLLTIPIAVFGITLIFIFITIAMMFTSYDGVLYGVFGVLSLISTLFSPIPCIIISIIGTVYANKIKNKNGSDILLVLGICEIIAGIIFVCIGVAMISAGQSV